MLYEVISQDLDDYSNGNGSSSTRSLKFINVFINNRSGPSEQLQTMLKMIQVDINDMMNEINEFVVQDAGNHSNNNDKSSTRQPKFINFSINNRLGYSKQFTITIEMI